MPPQNSSGERSPPQISFDDFQCPEVQTAIKSLNHVKEEFEQAQLRYMRILSDATYKSILDSRELLDLAQAGREYSHSIGQQFNELMFWLAFVDRTANSTPAPRATAGAVEDQ
jgi:hypothetical protein